MLRTISVFFRGIQYLTLVAVSIVCGFIEDWLLYRFLPGFDELRVPMATAAAVVTSNLHP